MIDYRKYLKLTGNILFGNPCPVCGKIMSIKKHGACRECSDRLIYIEEPFCKRCGKLLSGVESYNVICDECLTKEHYFDRAISVFEHTDIIKKSIYDFKFENRRKNASYYADTSMKIHGELLKNYQPDLLVPVPVSKSKERKRGYNQSEIFGRELAKRIGVKCCRDVLIKIDSAKEQKELSGTERFMNLKNCFSINEKRLEEISKADRILLVDDIYTTGSTVDVCSDILKKAGAKQVIALCISRGSI